MKTHTKLAIGLVFFALLGGCGSAEESAADYMESGKELMAEGKTDKARLEFKNVLQIDPTFAPAYYQLALIDEQNQNWRGVYENLSSAEALWPKDVRVLTKISQLHLLAGNYDIAIEKIELALSQQPENVDALVVRSTIALKQENYGQASETINKALEIAPDNIEVISVRASLHKAQGDYAQAIQSLDRALALEPQKMPLIMLKLSVYEADNNYTEMENLLKQLREDKPEASWVALSYARLLKSLGRDEEGLNLLKQFAEADPENTDVLFTYLAWLEEKNPEEMLAALDRFIAERDDKVELQFRKARYLQSNGDIAQAKTLLEQIIAANPESSNSLRARNSLAVIAFQQDDLAQAERLTEEVLALSSEDERALLMKSQLLIDSQQVEKAVTHLRIVLRNNPQSDQALVFLAQAYDMTGANELADDNFRQALTVNPGNTTAALSVANDLLERDQQSNAEQVLLTALQSQPNQPSLLEALAQVRMVQEDWSGSGQLVDTLATEYPKTGVSYYLDGKIAEGQGNYQSAVSHYKAALQKQPDMKRALQGLFNSYQQLDDKAGLREFLQTFSQQHPQQTAVKLMMADSYLQQGDRQQAYESIEKGISENPQWLPGYRKLAELYEQDEEFNKAEAAYKRGLSVNPDNPQLTMSLAMFYERQQQFSEAKSVYEQVLQRHPDYEPAINNLASLLTDRLPSQANFEKALELSSRFANSNEPYYLDTLAWSRFHVGELDAAQKLLEKVVDMAPNVAVFHYHLAAVYQKQNNTEAAQSTINTARELAEQQDDKQTLEQLSEL